MNSCLRVTFLLLFAVLLGQAALARDAVVVVTMAGEAYDGAPQFRLYADDQLIGSGELTRAFDTAKGEKLNLKKLRKRRNSERFSFDIPNIDAVSRLDVEFINDTLAGDGKPGNRNLYVLALSLRTVIEGPADSIVTIHEFRPTALEPVMPTSKGARIRPRYAALFRNGRLRLDRPAGGWQTLGEKAAGSKMPEIANAPKAEKSSAACNVPPLELAGFEKNASELSEAMREQLARLKGSLAGTSCRARVTAFTGGGPSQAFRHSLSQARMQAVAKELAGLGIGAEKITMESQKGYGRRIVVTFH
ncbi:hypothetical protein G5V57_33525 [Nordella sp. HKS 07]|uniref:carbohydrate-binding domain-containing protein n=1 Tax=Nordella sp. HKS 07 TaxID=2712222 RepID=UPI0013E0EE89|nr:carbohydrate-binding domain-containing protein [Nordella sp. HKS 07]QIG52191.1 hypothetical protein G5V57_33525 [Nordella sp. HKS 07]